MDALFVGLLALATFILGVWAMTLWMTRAVAVSPPPIAGGSVDPMMPIHEHLDQVMAAVTEVQEMIARRPAGAAPLGTLPPKPHRHQFMLTSEERTNKVLRKIYTCRVYDCPDTYIEEEPEPALQRTAD